MRDASYCYSSGRIVTQEVYLPFLPSSESVRSICEHVCRHLTSPSNLLTMLLQIYASKLKLHPVVVIGVLYVAEHLVGVQGLIMAVPCAVFVINNIILGNNGNTDKDGSAGAVPA